MGNLVASLFAERFGGLTDDAQILMLGLDGLYYVHIVFTGRRWKEYNTVQT